MWWRIIWIICFSLASILILSFVVILLIQSIILVGYFAMIPAILTWEKYAATKRFFSKDSDLSADERWVLTKMDLEKIQKQIDKCKNEAEKKHLNSSKSSLENKLRRLEWSLRESDLSEMYNAAKGNLGHLPDEKASSPPEQSPKGSDEEEMDSSKDEEMEVHSYESRNYLVKTLLDARAVLRNEPGPTLRLVLKPTANNLRAHYNALRRKQTKKSSPTFAALVSDYWACWVLLHALANNLPLEPDLPRYCSNIFRPKIMAFMKLVHSLGLEAPIAS